MVRLYHPELDRSIEVSEEAARVHVRKGWAIKPLQESVNDAMASAVDEYDSWRRPRLIEELEARGLETEGNNAERAERLRVSDASSPVVEQGGF